MATASSTHSVTRSRSLVEIERGHVGALVHGVADDEAFDQRHERVEERVLHVAVHEQPLRRDAGLPGMAEAGDRNLLGDRLEISARLDDQRGIVTELEPDLLARCLRLDPPTNLG